LIDVDDREESERQHVAELVAALRAIPDPDERMRAVARILTVRMAMNAQLGEVTREAARQVRDAHPELKNADLARRWGVSRQRVNALLR
jgi:hypothetical protein